MTDEAPEKDLGGRPPKEINLKALEGAASIGCTDSEMAAVVGVSETTLKNRRATEPEIQAAIDLGKANGKATLRRLQWQGAMRGDKTMLVWLGKQMLGQRDKVDHELSGKDGAPIKTQAVSPESAAKAYTDMIEDE